MNLDISQWVNVRQATVVAVFLAYIVSTFIDQDKLRG